MKNKIGEALTFFVFIFVIIPLLVQLFGYVLSPEPTAEQGGKIIVNAAIPWWIDLAKAPILLIAVFLLFSWVGKEDLL